MNNERELTEHQLDICSKVMEKCISRLKKEFFSGDCTITEKNGIIKLSIRDNLYDDTSVFLYDTKSQSIKRANLNRSGVNINGVVQDCIINTVSLLEKYIPFPVDSISFKVGERLEYGVMRDGELVLEYYNSSIKGYDISVYNNYLEPLDRPVCTLNPLEALNYFLLYNLERPTMVNLTCYTKDQVKALLETFLSNQEYFRERYWNGEKRYPVNFDYYVEACQGKLQDNCRGFLGKESFPDSVYPFCLG